MERVAIFGASSAIAAEVAYLYARRGARLHLVGRNETKLAATAERCAGAEVTTEVADFARLEENASVVERAVARLGRIEVAVVAHGDIGDQLASERSFDDAEPILRVNFTSAVSLLIPIANHMDTARAGRIGVMTSVAGERGRPRNYTYGAAKGALGIYLQGVRSRLHSRGVSVTTLKLGPVDSPMTRDHAKHALFGRPDAVARGIVRAIDGRTAEAYVPSFWGAIMPIVRNTPERIFQLLPFLSGR